MEATQTETPKRRVFTICNKQVDLDSALPLTIGDMRKLKEKGVDLVKKDATNIELEDLMAMVLYICQKSNPEISETDVDAMPTNWMTKIAQEVQKGGGEELPF